MPDIEVLRVIWWVLLGVLLMGFAITDGFDFGAAILSPFVAKTEPERRVVLNSIGPFWEGNQVWIILGAGAIFAAWPYVYAVAFSGLYLLILLLLLTMGISRPVSFKYRGKLPSYFWRRFWDWIVFFGGLFPAFIFGALVGNVLLGVPFYFDKTLRVFYTGSFFDLFSSFALICGLTSIAMLIMHGGLYLAIKTNDPIRSRAIFWSRWMAIFLIGLFVVGGYWIIFSVKGYSIVGPLNVSGPSNPLYKNVMMQVGEWSHNYMRYPLTIAAPLLGILGALTVFITANWGNSRFAFCASALSIIGIIGTVGVSMFPFILPSSVNPRSSLIVWDASSSALTLFVMLIAVIIFLPIILFYTAWVYHALRGKVTDATVEENRQSY